MARTFFARMATAVGMLCLFALLDLRLMLGRATPLCNSSITGKPFLALHWRSEKAHSSNGMWRNLTASGDAIIAAVSDALAHCRLTQVFLAVDFLEHGSQSLSKGAGWERRFGSALVEQYRRIQTRFNSIHFQPEHDYKEAHSASNAMAIAAAELSIMSRAAAFVPIVGSGFFVTTVQDERRSPAITAQAGPLPTQAGQSLCAYRRYDSGIDFRTIR